MSERRMFAKSIIDSDAFIDMPISARLLYYDLGMRADDDGFVNSPKKIMKFIGATNDDMNILIMRKFIIPFDNGIVVIKHWRIHNYIRKDMYHETKYKDQKAMLNLDANNAYTLQGCNEVCNEACNEPVTNPSTEVRLGKDRIGKDRLGKVNNNNNKGERFYADDALNDAFKDYIEFRRKSKKPMTDRAIELAIKELAKLSDGDNDKAIAILNQSILKGWTGLYDIKAEKPKGGGIDWDAL